MTTHGREVGFPDELWLGKIRHQWVIQAFPNQEMAARWASEGSEAEVGRRYVIGPVPIKPETFVARTSRVEPTKYLLEE